MFMKETFVQVTSESVKTVICVQEKIDVLLHVILPTQKKACRPADMNNLLASLYKRTT